MWDPAVLLCYSRTLAVGQLRDRVGTTNPRARFTPCFLVHYVDILTKRMLILRPLLALWQFTRQIHHQGLVIVPYFQRRYQYGPQPHPQALLSNTSTQNWMLTHQSEKFSLFISKRWGEQGRSLNPNTASVCFRGFPALASRLTSPYPHPSTPSLNIYVWWNCSISCVQCWDNPITHQTIIHVFCFVLFWFICRDTMS